MPGKCGIFPVFSVLRKYIDSAAHGRLSLWVLVLLAFAYALPGMVAFGPWKPDEPYTFGLVHSLLEGGDWIVPTLAGEPFMEKPPLMVWTAAIFAKFLSPWLQPEYGARLAIGFYLLIIFLSLAGATRRFAGNGKGRYAVLALLCSVGFVQPGHMLIPDIPLLAGVALACYGWSRILEQPKAGGAILGTGIGMAFMAKGLLGPGMLGVTGILLPLLFAEWRTQAYGRGLLFAMAASLPWLLIWPIALYLRSPDLFMDWFWLNNIGRFFGFSVPSLGASHESAHLLKTLPWFTFPLLPLAVWRVWKTGRAGLADRGMQLGLSAFGVMAGTMAVSASGRVVYLLPLLVPLALVAAPALADIPPRLSRLFDWSARLLFGALALACWAIWLSMVSIGKPPPWSLLAEHLPMNFDFHFQPLGFAAAVALLLACWRLWLSLPGLKARAAISWGAGLVLVWGTAFALLLPWIDAAKSLQSTFREIEAALPPGMHCLATRGLGESERGMLHYIAGVEPERIERHRGADCDALLWQGVSSEAPAAEALQGWQLRWQGARPGERRERFWVFVRTPRAVFASEQRRHLQN